MKRAAARTSSRWSARAPLALERSFGGFLLVLSLCGGSFGAPRPASPAAPAKRIDSSAFLERTMPIGNLGSITCNARRHAFNSTWTLLAAPQDGGSVRLFDVATGQSLPPLEGGFKVGTFTFTYTYADGVPSAYFAFSPDGTRLATVGWVPGRGSKRDYEVQIWNVAALRSGGDATR